jgi:hypothetical protein
MDTELNDADDRGPARIAPRDSLFLLTSLATPSGIALGKARVRNLSATGLMADCDAGLGRGQPVIVELRGVGKILGSIAWTKDGRTGITFNQPIDPQLARKPTGEGGSKPLIPDYLRMTGKKIRG